MGEGIGHEARSELDVPECTACGACCLSTLDRYVEVSGDDHARLRDDAERLVQFIGNRAYMRIVDGRCAALAVDSERVRFACTVYERRPRICRDLERGSPACAGERWTKDERRLVLLRRGPAKHPDDGSDVQPHRKA